MRPGMLTRGRAMAESLMTLTVTAERPGDVTVPDLATMTDRAPWIPAGKSIAKVQTAGRQPQGREVTVGGAKRVVIEGGLHLPLGAYFDDAGKRLLIAPGWRFTVTGVGVEDDPALLGQRYLVVEVLRKSRVTARRLDVVEV